MMAERVIEERFVLEAEAVCRRALGMGEDWELRRYMGFDVRQLVAQIAVALEGESMRELVTVPADELERVMALAPGWEDRGA